MADASAAGAPAVPAPRLDELMMAMDVVDTLRHQEGLVEKELSQENRDAVLKDRLRKLYESQGLAVSDRILEEGIRALKESRFSYTPPPPSLGLTLAKLWVRRGTVGKVVLVLALLVAGAIGYTAWQRSAEQGAAEQARIEITETLPKALAAAAETTLAEAKDAAGRKRIEALRADGEAALKVGDAEKARAAVAGLDALRAKLVQEYELRIVSRPGEQTGVFRIPDANEGTRNYYLIVEAVTPSGDVLSMPVTSEEDGKTTTVTKWAVRVPQETYDAVAADKRDDGIVQDNVLAEKPRGALDPVSVMRVQGGAITSW